jgi:hypothetical protein
MILRGLFFIDTKKRLIPSPIIATFQKTMKKKTIFRVKEKRIVTYNPSLAKKQRAEIEKQVEKSQK